MVAESAAMERNSWRKWGSGGRVSGEDGGDLGKREERKAGINRDDVEILSVTRSCVDG